MIPDRTMIHTSEIVSMSQCQWRYSVSMGNGLPGIVAASRSYAVMEPSKKTTRSHRLEQNMNSQYRFAITQRFLVNFVSSDLQPTSALHLTNTHHFNSGAEYDSSGSSRRAGCRRCSTSWLIKVSHILDTASRNVHG